METLERARETCSVRRLRPADLHRVVALDEMVTGRERRGYFVHKLEENLLDTSVQVSLGAEVDGILVGFLLARMWTGEFGATDPVAVLDTIGVQPSFQGRGVGHALLEQLHVNLRALNVGKLRTEVEWDGQEMIRFLHREGFRPAARLSLELDLDTLRD